MNELNSQKVRKLAPEKDLVQSKNVILSGGKDLVQSEQVILDEILR